MFQDTINNTFEDRHSHVGQKARVSFNNADNVMIIKNKLQSTNVERLVLNKPTSLNRNFVEQTQIAEMSSSGARNGYRPSSRIDRLAKPLARLRKPLIRLNAVFREVDHQIPWCKKGPSSPNNKIQVIHPPPQPGRTKTGVSRAALKYEASENIKRLAQHRPILKADDEKKCFSVKPLSLIYKPSLRIHQLSKPRIHVVKT